MKAHIRWVHEGKRPEGAGLYIKAGTGLQALTSKAELAQLAEIKAQFTELTHDLVFRLGQLQGMASALKRSSRLYNLAEVHPKLLEILKR